jgi:hypothetical protein
MNKALDLSDLYGILSRETVYLWLSFLSKIMFQTLTSNV